MKTPNLIKVFLVIVCSATIYPPVNAIESNSIQLEDGAKFADSIVKIISEHHQDAAQISKMLSPIKKAGLLYIKVGLPTSMVSQKQLVALERDVLRLNSIGTTVPSPLASKEAIRKIAMGGGPGNPTDTPRQLARYKSAGLARELQIRRVAEKRGALIKSVVQMKKDALAAVAVSQKLEGLVGNTQLEVIARMSGRSFVMSVIDYTNVVVPALENRVQSGDAAVVRLDKIIEEMRTDLGTYHQMLATTAWLFEDVSRLPPARPPAPGQEQSALIVSDAEKLNRTLVQTQELVQNLRDEARSIAERNAPLNALTSLLEIGSKGLAVLGAVSGEGKPTAEGASKPPKVASGSVSPPVRIRWMPGRAWVETVTPTTSKTHQPKVEVKPPP